MKSINLKSKFIGLLKHPLFAGSFLMIGGSTGVNFINYFYHLIMGRVLGPLGYGVLASIFSLLYIISIVPMSTSVSIVKFISSAKNKNEISQIYYSVRNLAFKISLIGGTLLIVFSHSISNFLNINELTPILLVGPIIVFSLLWLVNQATLQGLLYFEGVVFPNVLGSVGRLVIGLFFVFLGWAVTGAVWGILLGYILAFLYSYILVRKHLTPKREKFFDITPLLKFSFPTLLQALAFTSIFTVDLLLVKHFLPPFEAGLYAALSTLGKIIFFAVTPISSVMFPIVSGRNSKGQSYKKVLYASLMATIFISLGIVFFYWFFPDLAIGVLFGEKYLLAQKELVLMGLFLAFYTLCYLLVNFQLSISNTRVVVLPVVAAILQIVGILVWHATVGEVIKVSLACMVLLFLSILVYIITNTDLREKYIK